MLHAFDAYGLELEYALVDRSALDVKPIADRVLQEASGAAHAVNDWDRGELGWSNELVLHMIELKNIRPTPSLSPLVDRFQHEVREMNERLAQHGARLMPGGMHPWMDSKQETRLWPHENAGIYRAYDRIFDCRRHGWANVQSAHVNLPFGGDDEFARLYAAARVVLPILPALTASSPYADGRASGYLDYRMEAYRTNADTVPELNGDIVPDSVATRSDYEERVLKPLYRAIAPHDTEDVLQEEWLNARGAIARFDRNALEIRVVDMQECPLMDVGCAAFAIDLIHIMYEERFSRVSPEDQLPTRMLREIFLGCVKDADRASIRDAEYLDLFGLKRRACEAGELWWHIAEQLDARMTANRATWKHPVEYVLTRGPLARRLLRALGPRPSRAALHELYSALCEALDAGRPFDP